MWAFLRTIRTNPIYLREQGRWGEPNQYYATLMRYLPLIILLVLGLGVFCGSGQLSTLVGLGDDEGILLALFCIPNILVQVLTWIGVIIAPTLTAPAVVEEVQKGSWDILRLTPMPTMHIIWAKLLGGLSRLRIWTGLLILSALYGIAMGISIGFVGAIGNFSSGIGPIFWGIVTGLMVFIRPWIEIGFSGLSGLTLSLWTSSARASLIGTYVLVMVWRVVIGNAIWWLGAGGMMSLGFESSAWAVGSFGLNVFYILSCVALFFLMRRRAMALDRGEFLDR